MATKCDLPKGDREEQMSSREFEKSCKKNKILFGVLRAAVAETQI